MHQIIEKLLNRVEDNSRPKLILDRKPHRTVARGLKLMSDDMLNTVRLSSTVAAGSTTDIGEGEQSEVDFTELPHHLFIHEILARLPCTCLLQLMSVSKQWYSNVSSYEFANAHFKSHLSHYHPSSPVERLFIQVANKFYLLSFQEEAIICRYCLVKLEPGFDGHVENDVHLVGSCNGLVCLADSSPSPDHFYIWNPVNYNLRKFLVPCLIPCHCTVSWGFIYVSSEDNYKVVKIIQDYENSTIIVHIFSMRTQTWRIIHDNGLGQDLSLTNTNPGVSVNDTLHWIMVARGPSMKHVIVCFNPSLEKFEEFPGLVPRNINPRESFLCVMGGCLSLYCSNLYHEADLFIFKQPEERKSICFPCCTNMPSCCGMIGFTKIGKAIFVSKASEIYMVDLNSSPTLQLLLVTLEETRKPSIATYVPSLISPFAITEF